MTNTETLRAKCILCNTTILLPHDNIILPESFICSKCQKSTNLETIDVLKTDFVIIEDGQLLHMARRCKSCNNVCKIFTVTKTAKLYCPRYTRRKDENF